MHGRLAASFFTQSALRAAAGLVGMTLVHRVRGRRRAGRILEAEAYGGPEDRASHAARGRGPQPGTPAARPGLAYVYLSHGRWPCLNVVVGKAARPQFVLIRALEPLEGFRARADGPGLLCKALGIGLAQDQAALRGLELWVEKPLRGTPRPRLQAVPRIGLNVEGPAAGKRWRFRMAKTK